MMSYYMDVLIRNHQFNRFTLSGTPFYSYYRDEADEAKVIMVVDNTGLRYYSGEELNEAEERIRQYLLEQGKGIIDVLFIVYSNNTKRDKYIGDYVQCWIADTKMQQINIYENQPDDFAGLYNYICNTAFKSDKNKVKRKLPVVTLSIILINVVVFIWLEINGSTTDVMYMLSHGASYCRWEIERHEYYRLFTCMFLHFGIAHLFNNMLTLCIIGEQAEYLYGWKRYLGIYLGTGLISSITSTIYNMTIAEPAVSAGASGAIYGVMGAVAAALVINYRKQGNMIRRMLVVIILIVYSGVTSTNVDTAAHIGGFISGIIIGGIMIMRIRKTSKKAT